MTKSVITAMQEQLPFVSRYRMTVGEQGRQDLWDGQSHPVFCTRSGLSPVRLLFHEMARLWEAVWAGQNHPESYPFGSHLPMGVALASEPAAAGRWRGVYHYKLPGCDTPRNEVCNRITGCLKNPERAGGQFSVYCKQSQWPLKIQEYIWFYIYLTDRTERECHRDRQLSMLLRQPTFAGCFF